MTRTAEEVLPEIVRASDDGQSLLLLDQRLLPGEVRYIELSSVADVAEAIRSLAVRGAPAIGVVAALGLAMGLRWHVRSGASDMGRLREEFEADRAQLAASRPTGRNLEWALRRVERAFQTAETPSEAAEVTDAEAGRVLAEEQASCRAIGEAGAALLPPEGAAVLTHCNAGALATGGIGTATAPMYVAAERGVPLEIFADETRPVLQGGRLTAWELSQAGLDVTVVTDSMAGALMAQGKVDLVVVGADAVTLDGGVVNKIGTYGLAVLARHHGLPFYVAIPTSTLERELEAREVPIEERDPTEVRGFGGVTTVPDEASVWNPAFDVTPPELVTAIITEAGVVRPPYRPKLTDLAMGRPLRAGVEQLLAEEGP